MLIFSLHKLKFEISCKMNRTSNYSNQPNFAMQGYYIATSRELTRLSSITRAPVIYHFSETISGIMTIRSFRKQATFFEENVKKLDASVKTDFHNSGANEWLGFRVELLGGFVICISTLFMILLPRNLIGPGINYLLCLQFSYLIKYLSYKTWLSLCCRESFSALVVTKK